MSSQTSAAGVLVVVHPPALRGQRFALDSRGGVLGRDPRNAVVVDDAGVARQHARWTVAEGTVFLEDLGGSPGTALNGEPMRGRTPLRHGDLLGFGPVRARFEAALSAGSGDPRDITIGDQYAGIVNNVGRDQHNNAYVTQVLQQRESFLRDVAAARTAARWLIWIGSLLTVAGFGAWAWVVLGLFGRIPSVGSDVSPGDFRLLGPDVGGVPFGVYAFGAMLLGMVLIVIGVVRHVTSTARRRRVDQEFPLPYAAGPYFR